LLLTVWFDSAHSPLVYKFTYEHLLQAIDCMIGNIYSVYFSNLVSDLKGAWNTSQTLLTHAHCLTRHTHSYCDSILTTWPIKWNSYIASPCSDNLVSLSTQSVYFFIFVDLRTLILGMLPYPHEPFKPRC